MTATADTIRVLHVDDVPEFGDLVATRLERESDRFDVRTAKSADEGMTVLAAGNIDCVVADYDMPERDGLEFLETVREVHPDLPFVLYTGKGSETVASEAISAGVTDYLQKDRGPDQYALLANRIRNAVERVRATRQAASQRRINTVVRTVNEALARSTTRSEIDERVCAILSDAEPYRFAWIGEHDAGSRTVEPRRSAGIDEAYLAAIEITTDEDPTALGPTGRAVRSRELAVMQNIPEDPRYEPWRDAALQRGYQSSAAVPLVYDDVLYGVLNVYADRTYAFDEGERRLLADLGETIGHAYHRIELQRQYADQYSTLFEEAPVMFVFTRTVEGEPIIEDCNRAFAERLGYANGEIEGTPLADYYTAESADLLLEGNGYQRALSEEFVREQRTLVARDGEEVLTILRASPRRSRDGELVGVHAMFLDITDETQVQRLERRNDRLDEFASVLSHDLRNPLNVARGRLTLVGEECDSDHLAPIDRAHERMESLIEDLLTLAREGAAVTDREPVDLSTTVDACWENVETGDGTVSVECDRTVLADESRLKQIFENLFRNAVEHGGNGVSVTIGELPDGFYVEDDGPGIPDDDRDRVFEAGYSSSREGTGFGLSIIKRIVEAHDWNVRVIEGSAGGARFEITGVEFST
ncbi:ATP-binding protein [Halorubrum sp. DTA98]|uniref:hybrid sensor histidine kinase/response regulator n=1 Tax=Halorubrum sp. DTA98 TaxID=3402163 RepID=UPI003AABE45A